MPDQTVVLEQSDWQQVMNIIATTKDHPWVVTNPLLMKLGPQLQAQTPGAGIGPSPYANQSLPGNGLDPEPEEINPRRVPRTQ